MLVEFIEYFDYAFVRNAFFVGILVSICTSLLGVNIVVKRLSFIGESLSHGAFSLIALASVIKLFDNILLQAILMIAITYVIINYTNKANVKSDSLLTVLSVSSLGIGYFVMSVSPTTSTLATDVCTIMFGSASILTLTSIDVILTIILSFIVIITYIVLYDKLYAITFDIEYAKINGLNTKLYQGVFSVLLAIIIVLAVNLVGSLLISALIIFPALTCIKLFTSFKSIVISSVIFSSITTLFGLSYSVMIGTPVGPTIIIVQLILFILVSLVRKN